MWSDQVVMNTTDANKNIFFKGLNNLVKKTVRMVEHSRQKIDVYQIM